MEPGLEVTVHLHGHEPMAFMASASLQMLIYFGIAMGAAQILILSTTTRNFANNSSSNLCSLFSNLVFTSFSLTCQGPCSQKTPPNSKSPGAGHVLTGPDHLSALAMLSVGTTFRAFVTGVRWGIGHRYATPDTHLSCQYFGLYNVYQSRVSVHFSAQRPGPLPTMLSTETYTCILGVTASWH